MLGSPSSRVLNQGSVEKDRKAVQQHSGLSGADTLCTSSLSQHSTADSSDNATERESRRVIKQ